MEVMNDIWFSSSSLLATPMAVDEESRFHVLAVDDSLIDRKLIETLLRVSSYRGTFLSLPVISRVSFKKTYIIHICICLKEELDWKYLFRFGI